MAKDLTFNANSTSRKFSQNMNAAEFLSEYQDGRIDFSGVDLSGQNIFHALLETTHPNLFDGDLSKIARAGSPSSHKKIQGIQLPGAMLPDATLTRTNLKRSNLCHANLSGVEARQATFAGSKLRNICFTGANLTATNMAGCDLEGADFSNAILDDCNLDFAKLTRTKFSNTSLLRSKFTHTTFNGASIHNCAFDYSYFYISNLVACEVTESSFRRCLFIYQSIVKSTLEWCDLSESRFINPKFANSKLTATTFNDCAIKKLDIERCILFDSKFKNAAIVDGTINNSEICDADFTSARMHALQPNNSELRKPLLAFSVISEMDLEPLYDAKILARTSIDFPSIAKTITKSPAHPLAINPLPKLQYFLESCGIPSVSAMYAIDSIRSLQPNQIKSLMQSTFISYGSPDEKFAKQLNSDLLKNGVETFFFPLDAKFGEKLHATMKRVDNYDRIILICSEESLNRNAVQYEIEKVIEREAREGGESYLIPVTIDSFLFSGWDPTRHHLKQEILNRVVADFRETSSYPTQFRRLLQALKKE